MHHNHRTGGLKRKEERKKERVRPRTLILAPLLSSARAALARAPRFKNVQQFLKRKGIGPNSTTDEILQFVPSSIVLRMWPDRVRGELGADAQGGYVAFSIFQPSALDSEYSDATYLIVMRLTGEIESVKIFETGDPEYGAPRIDGLKARRRIERWLSRWARAISDGLSTKIGRWGRANTGVIIGAPRAAQHVLADWCGSFTPPTCE